MAHAVHALADVGGGLAAPGADPIRVLIAEGQGLVRAGFRVLLEREQGMCVAAEAATGEEAVAAAQLTRPDVEREVVGLVACGLSNEEIAERLVVTRATAKTHASRALCKLRARDRARLVVLAYETGLVPPGPRWPEVPVTGFARSPVAGAPRRAALHPVAA